MCPVKLRIGATGSDCYDLYRCVQLGVRSDLWSGTIGMTYCTDTSPYVTATNGLDGWSVDIDIWQAILDDEWSSSLAIEVYAHISTYSMTKIISAGPSGLSNPTPVTKSATLPLGDTFTCPTNLFGTVTVYDDGTLSFA